MGIALTDDHRELAEVARSFLTSQKARWAARSLLDAPEEERPPFWQGIVELGWLGLHVDEEHGGSGFGLPELVVVIDELGRAVAPGTVRPDRDRFGGDRQRRHQPNRSRGCCRA